MTAWTALRSPAVQTVTVKHFLANLSEKTGTTISVGRVRYGLNKNLLVRNILIQDQKKDTLLFIPRLETSVKDLDLNNKSINLYSLKINNAYSNIVQLNDSTFNFSFIINNTQKDKNNKFDWIINCETLHFSNASVNINSATRKKHQIEKLTFNAKDIHVDSANQNFVLTDFSNYYNKNKFIETLSFNAGIFNNHIIIQNLNTHINGSNANIPSAFLQLPNKHKNEDLRYEVKITSSYVEPKTFARIIPKLEKIQMPFNLNGSFSGTKNDINSNKFHFIFGEESSIEGNFNIQNINHIKETNYSIDIKNLYAINSDVIDLITFIRNDTVTLPPVLNSVRDISYSGIINGDYNSLYNKGIIMSQIGQLSTDLILKKDTIEDRIFIDGNLIANPIYPDLIIKDSLIHEVSFNINTNGFISSTKNTELNIDGYLKNIHLPNYVVDSVGLKGLLQNKMFKGRIASYDNNVRFDFDGAMNFDSIPSYDFDFILYSANLHKLGLVKKDTTANLSFECSADFVGNNIDNTSGEIYVSDIFYFTDTSYFATDSVYIISEPAHNGRRMFFYSEYAEANIDGHFNSITLFRSIKTVINNYMPSLGFAPSKTETKNNIQFNIVANYPHPITELIDPSFKISAGTHIYGSLNAKNLSIDLNCQTDQISYKDRTIKNFDLKGYTRNKTMYLNITSNELKYTQKNSLKNFNVSTTMFNDSIVANFNWNNWLDESYSGNINTLFTINGTPKSPSFKLDINPSNIIVLDTLWIVHKSFIQKDSSGIRFHNIKIDNGSSKWELSGIYSSNPNDSIVLDVKNLNVDLINILLKNDKLVFGGKITGKTQILDISGEQKINSDLFVKQLTLNSELIGDAKIETRWKNEEKKLLVKGHALNNNEVTFGFNGFISPSNDTIAINTIFNYHSLNVLRPYIKPTFDNAEGFIKGEILLHGHLKNPSWEGKVLGSDIKFRVAPTNVYYSFNDSVYFNNHHIIFKNLKAYDKYNNIAFANGNINHYMFRDFYYNLQLESNHILAIDLKRNSNPYYFGTMFGAGNMALTGGGTTVNIDIAAKTTGPSFIQIPIESKGEIEDSDFIEFTNPLNTVNSSKLTNNEIKTATASTITNLRIDLDVTPAIEVQILFDPRFGDMLRANGVAQLSIESLGPEFNMYGDYTITKGDFMFTLQNVINKRLEMQQGGSVSWNGHPLDADIDLDAVYRVRKASVFDLTLDETDRDKRIEVNTHLLMTGKLTNQNIEFKVDVPYATNADVVDQLNTLPKEDLNKQVLSLLLVNRFTALSTYQTGIAENSTGNLTSTTASELLSNQLSNWMSQISNDFDLGFVYRPGDETTEQEVEFALSTNLFNDRVVFNGNVGYSRNKQNLSPDNTPYTTDFQLEYKLNDKGNLRLRAFQKPNNDILLSEADYTQGVGVFYTEEFDTIGELMQKIFRKEVGNKPDDVEIKEESTETN